MPVLPSCQIIGNNAARGVPRVFPDRGMEVVGPGLVGNSRGWRRYQQREAAALSGPGDSRRLCRLSMDL